MEWTPRQREQIILTYGHEGIAFCPIDHEPLVPDEAPDGSRGLNLRCRKCGRQLRSSISVPVGVTWAMAPAVGVLRG